MRNTTTTMLQMFTALLICAIGMLASTPVLAFDYYQTLPEKPLLRADNPQTADKIELGRHLFYDKRLSGTNTLS